MTAMVGTDLRTVTETIAAPGITLVDFTAEWCAPCRMLAPVLEQLDAEAGDLTLLEVDADAASEVAAAFEVMSFPTLVFFVDGQPIRRLVGARGLASLREELQRVREAAVSAES